jgi:hypothetical protein
MSTLFDLNEIYNANVDRHIARIMAMIDKVEINKINHPDTGTVRLPDEVKKIAERLNKLK